MSKSKRNRSTHSHEDEEQAERKAGRRHRRQDDADAKAHDARQPTDGLGARSIRIVKGGHPYEANPLGRRAEPTRYDAMPIAGHQRLPGYETPPRRRDRPAGDDGVRSPDPTEEPVADRRRVRRDDES